MTKKNDKWEIQWRKTGNKRWFTDKYSYSPRVKKSDLLIDFLSFKNSAKDEFFNSKYEKRLVRRK